MSQRTKLPIDQIQMVDRQRADYRGIEELATSLKEVGLIQPIVINQDLRLIAGGRRLTAAKSLGWTHIDVVFRETLSEDELQVLELEENTKRVDLTWQERVLAIAKIHSIKQRTAVQTREPWGERETGELFGISKGNVGYTLRVARAIAAGHKGVIEAGSITEALRVLLLEREDEAMRLLAAKTVVQPATNSTPLPGEAVQNPVGSVALPGPEPDTLGLTAPLPRVPGFTDPAVLQEQVRRTLHNVYLHNFHLGDCVEWMASRFDRPCIDAIITDPPYAIDMEYLDQAAGGLSNVDRIADTHTVEGNLDLFPRMIPEFYRILKDNGFCVLWCDIMRWQLLYDLLTKVGFSVQRWPLVWVKTSPCINQSAHRNYTKNVEFAIVARKGNAILAKPSSTCVVAASNSEKLNGHPFTKPKEVWDFILRHCCIQNSLVIDPFMGVGSGVLSFLDAGHRVMGCEIDPTHHAYAIENVKQWYLAKNPNTVFV